jgi:hypothetical protein
MKEVQIHVHAILLADHPLTQDQRRALKAVIEMCDVWNKISPGFAKVIADFKEKGLLPSDPKID